jgi:phosphoglycerate dehydrogenase-like enzyme
LHRQVLLHPSVRYFHVGGSGFDHLLPLEGEAVITNSAGVLAPFLAETVIAGILALNGNFPAYDRLKAARQWRQLGFRPLAGQTLLVVGLGAIGRETAVRAKALGMRVIGTRAHPEPDPALDAVHSADALLDLLPEADFVSLHVRLSPETRRMIGAEALARMKPTACLINTARGGVVDEPALIEALRDQRIKGAYLDVFDTEPLPPESPLWDLENVILTPHASDNVTDYPERFAALFADNFERWRANKPLINQIWPK